MTKKLLIVLCLLLPVMAAAQRNDKLANLKNLVTEMRNTGGAEKTKEKLTTQLTANNAPLVTLLDNLAPDNANAEHHPKKESFKVNGVVGQAYSKQTGVLTSRGDYYDSLDYGVNYSLIEKAVKAQSGIAYTLKGHYGAQEFYFIPYDAAKSKLEVAVTVDGKTVQSDERTDSNILHFYIPKLEKTSVVKISIKNASPSSAAFVIMNYNSKKN